MADPGGSSGRGGSARKGYLFQATGVNKGRDFTSHGARKGQKNLSSRSVKRPKTANRSMHFMVAKKLEKTFWFPLFIHILKTEYVYSS